LIAFGKLKRLDLLIALFEHLIIPPEVEREVRVGVQRGFQHSLEIAALMESGKIEVLASLPAALDFQRRINLGEIGAIRLALRERADLVLIDDRDARNEAERLGLQVKGTIGVILSANRHRLISNSDTIALLETIRENPDIWIGRKIVEEAIVEMRSQRG
jgi:predicted nucleic acid-binding protein